MESGDNEIYDFHENRNLSRNLKEQSMSETKRANEASSTNKTEKEKEERKENREETSKKKNSGDSSTNQVHKNLQIFMINSTL